MLILILTPFFAVGLLFAAVCLCARRARPVRKADCIVVLGARVWPDGRLSASLENRCLKTLELANAGIAQHIILCGGRQKQDEICESLAMRRYLEQNGVEAQLYEDAHSLTTCENLKNAREIMRAQGFETAVVVSSDYHLQRVMWIARDLGMRACAAKAASPARRKYYWKARVQESVSWILYFVRRCERKDG